MSVSINFYLPGGSWLHRTDPRVKLLFVGSTLLLLLMFQNLWLMLGAMLLLLALHRSAGTPLSKLGFILKTLLPVALLMMILRTVFYPEGEPVISFWVVEITKIGIAQGLVLALRILTMAFAVFAWLYTTTQADLVQSMVRLGLRHEWGLVLALALRYIPTFQGTFTLISEAQQARGLNIQQHTGFKRVRIMMPIFVAMIISSLRDSGHLATALEARGYGKQRVTRTALVQLRFRRWDYALSAFLLLLLLSLTYLNIRYGFGEQPLALF